MARSRIVQSNLTTGEVSPTLRGRIDIAKYYNGVSHAENVIIMPHGGMRRRPGLAKIDDEYAEGVIRIESFVFNVDQTYLIAFRPSFIDIYRDGSLVSTVINSPYLTDEIITGLDIIQSADTMIIAHEDYAPYLLQRQGSDTYWRLSLAPLTNVPDKPTPQDYTNTGAANTVTVNTGAIVYNNDGDAIGGADQTYYELFYVGAAIPKPTYTFDLSTEDYTIGSGLWKWIEIGMSYSAPIWSNREGWPRTTTFHSARLWFGGSTSYPNSVWGSVVNDFFNFDLGTGAADEAIFDTLDTDQFNLITGIFSGRHLQLFTKGGEFYNSSRIITPEDSQWSRQTSYGSQKIRPISVDGSTMYIDSSGRTIRNYVWAEAEDSYISLNATLISSHIVKEVKAFATIKGTADDISDFVYVVNTDGTVAVMNTMRHENINGWTRWTTFGTFKDVAVVDKEVYFLVERSGLTFIEKLTEETHTDHNSKIFGVEPEEFNVVYGIDNVVFGADNVVYADAAEGTPVTTITLDEKDQIAVHPHKVIADGFILPDQIPTSDGVDLNHITIENEAYSIETGFNYTVKIRTLPLNVESQGDGAVVNLRKRVLRVILNLYESLGVHVDGKLLHDRIFPETFITTAVPFTGIKEKYLLGYGRQVEVEITQEEPLPMSLLSIDSEIEI